MGDPLEPSPPSASTRGTEKESRETRPRSETATALEWCDADR